MASIRNDWRLMSLLPAASFGLVLLLGFLAWNYLMLQASPDFGRPPFADIAVLRPALGDVVAGKHSIVTLTLLLVIAASVLAAIAAWTAAGITREVRGSALTAMAGADTWASIGVVIAVTIPAFLAVLGDTQCGEFYLYQCLGKGILPGLFDDYLAKLSVTDIAPALTLRNAAIAGNAAVAAAAFTMLAAMTLLPRGLEQAGAVPAIGDLKTWFARRVRRFELLSFLTSLMLVAGIAQLNSWMKWPLVLMNEEVLVGEQAVAQFRANYEALADSVLQYSAVWYGLMVAALIFTTRLILSHKCRQLADRIVSDPNAAQADKDAAQSLIDETFSGSSAQVYFERYRTYLLALAPAIAQQLLQAFGG
jgi:hypothetical protein